jgi:hypothetical protein
LLFEGHSILADGPRVDKPALSKRLGYIHKKTGVPLYKEDE